MAKHVHDPKQKFSHALELEHAGVVSLLEDVLAGLRSGELVLEHGREAVTLRPQGNVEVTIEAKRKPGRERLRLELEWEPEVVEPKLRVGPGTVPEPIRRRSVVAMKQARRQEGEVERVESVDVSADALRRLPKERLYALAQAVGLDGRSQLHKTALARALAERDVRGLLSDADLQMMQDDKGETADS